MEWRRTWNDHLGLLINEIGRRIPTSEPKCKPNSKMNGINFTRK